MAHRWFRAPLAVLAAALLAGACSPAAARPPSNVSRTVPVPVVDSSATPASAVGPGPGGPASQAASPAASAAMSDGERWLLFELFVADGRKGGFLVRPDGTGLHQILGGPDQDVRGLSWSPDGNRIAFGVRDSATPDGSIWTARADGTGAALLYDGRADGCGAVWDPMWSPDGTRLALICYQGFAGSPDEPNAASLGVLDVRSQTLTVVATTHWPDWLDNQASWSPDGRTIAYDVLHWDPTNRDIDGSRILTTRVDGSGRPRALDALDSFAATPDWSPDGKRLAYNSYDLGNMPDSGPSNLYTMAANGGHVRQVTTASTGPAYRIGHPRWDPDGERIWVTIIRAEGVFLGWVDPGSGKVTDLGVKGSRPKPRPTTSPDRHEAGSTR
jgi:WD40 repeat protein